MRILVTGGAGYIGSHTCVALLEAGHDVVVYDNLKNSSAGALERIQQITGRALAFIQGDIRDSAALDRLFQAHPPEVVFHFAGLKSVAESVRDPLAYYDTNVNGSLCLLRAMDRAGMRRLIFSSSATVYDLAAPLPFREDSPLAAASPYGETKLTVERLLQNLAQSSRETGKNWEFIALRYFNPVGAHASGLLGENPRGAPNNLMPFICQVAA
ncbi:MAG: SDR family NAD(P)-dependent oxidoreductase, partial [Alphaproteobacteria bacterium]|nr:SDR family NAD(P)-dependent oxidoreductase [Alphaproteobacteria bacterium]